MSKNNEDQIYNYCCRVAFPNACEVHGNTHWLEDEPQPPAEPVPTLDQEQGRGKHIAMYISPIDPKALICICEIGHDHIVDVSQPTSSQDLGQPPSETPKPSTLDNVSGGQS